MSKHCQLLRLLSLGLLSCLLLVACAPGHDEVLFERLLALDYGAGIKLGLPAGQITPTLGVASVIQTQQAGQLMQHCYLPDKETEYLADRPQLQLSYFKEQLVRIRNFERPFELNPAQPPAPKRITLLTAITLGSRKSDFVTKLGVPNYGILKNQWRFISKDGRSITIQAFFSENPDSKEPICSEILVALSPKVSEQRGEQYEGKS